MSIQTETWIYRDASIYGNLKEEGEIEGKVKHKLAKRLSALLTV